MSNRHQFAAAAASYDNAAVLAHEVGRRMAERLDCVRVLPHRMADIGCATGQGVRLLQTRYPRAQAFAIDFALPMLQAVRQRTGWMTRLSGRTPRLINADVRTLPLAEGCLDLIWSNLMLHWLDGPDDLRTAFFELHRVLADDGLLHFSLLGPDTLKELRDLGAPIRRFPDMHDIGDLLLVAGFSDPVVEMETLTLTYPDPRGFLADHRRLGTRALLGQLPWPAWRRLLHTWPRNENGDLPATFEVLYGHAWKIPRPRETTAVMHFQRLAI